MAERTHIPASPACGQWETLLADALDGLLKPEDEAMFTAHMSGCTACTALFDEARRGREWLEFLAPEPEVPAGLVDRILAHTGPGHKTAQPALAGAGAAVLPAGMLPGWQRPGFMGHVRRWAEPRLMMTVAMAFFSIALTLNLTGVRITEIRLSDLRPSAVRSFMERRINMASVPIIRYYDHLRFVYEVQSRMRELRGESEESQPQKSAPPAGQGESKKNQKDGGSRVDPPQQSVQHTAGNPDYVETSLTSMPQIRAFRRLQNVAVSRATAVATLPSSEGTLRSGIFLKKMPPSATLKRAGGLCSRSIERSSVWTA